MDNELICCVDMFSAYQTLVTPIGEKIYVSEDEINEMAINYCLNNNLDTIHYFGNEEYIKGMYIKPMMAFANENITIKVN